MTGDTASSKAHDVRFGGCGGVDGHAGRSSPGRCFVHVRCALRGWQCTGSRYQARPATNYSNPGAGEACEGTADLWMAGRCHVKQVAARLEASVRGLPLVRRLTESLGIRGGEASIVHRPSGWDARTYSNGAA